MFAVKNYFITRWRFGIGITLVLFLHAVGGEESLPASCFTPSLAFLSLDD
jgi:hypothetical protein